MRELVKEIHNGRILKNNGSWMYCDRCGKTVGYLCYTTYQDFQFDFVCKCGTHGSFRLKYPSDKGVTESDKKLITVKNRLCCPIDNSPLFTIVDKNVDVANYSVICKKCMNRYEK
jgi:hypothetical protein